MFRKKKTAPLKQFDKEHYQAILRCSICTGEQVAGFKEKNNGKFHEVSLIKSTKDLEEFKKMYDVDEIIKEY